MDMSFLTEQLEYNDVELARVAEKMAEQFDILAAEVRSRFGSAIANGRTEDIIRELGAFPSMAAKAVINADTIPLANLLTIRVALEQRIAIEGAPS